MRLDCYEPAGLLRGLNSAGFVSLEVLIEIASLLGKSSLFGFLRSRIRRNVTAGAHRVPRRLSLSRILNADQSALAAVHRFLARVAARSATGIQERGQWRHVSAFSCLLIFFLALRPVLRCVRAMKELFRHCASADFVLNLALLSHTFEREQDV